ncbi:MAG TPA: hypothetical protein VIJ07_03480 [Dermatophilaceae bacterium]
MRLHCRATPTHGGITGVPAAGVATTGAADVLPAPNWLTVTDPAVAVAWLNTVQGRVHRVWARYAPIPGCWPWHPSVFAELLVTHLQWDLAVTDGAGTSRPRR